VEKHPAGKPCQIEAQRRRAALISRLGGVCKDGFCFETERLEFDHLYESDWDPAKLSRLQRIARYESDADAGLIQLLCRSHNAADGSRRRWVKKVR
jgi:hypothetical protein